MVRCKQCRRMFRTVEEMLEHAQECELTQEIAAEGEEELSEQVELDAPLDEEGSNA